MSDKVYMHQIIRMNMLAMTDIVTENMILTIDNKIYFLLS